MDTKMKIIFKSYPGHKGRPGQVGGSAPRSGGSTDGEEVKYSGKAKYQLEALLGAESRLDTSKRVPINKLSGRMGFTALYNASKTDSNWKKFLNSRSISKKPSEDSVSNWAQNEYDANEQFSAWTDEGGTTDEEYE